MVKTRNLIRFLILFFISLTFFSCSSTIYDRSTRFNENDAFNVRCQNVMQVAQYWIGVPYLYGGNDYRGVDCSGFVQAVYADVFRIDLPRTTAEMYENGNYVRNGIFECGDLLFFKDIRGRGVDHVGIYIGENRFVHASSSGGVVISSLESVYYKEHFVAARRYF
ncbi:MAG: C40 family peptidase [Calditrichaeota bacterium]|nr:C40 family peptidase [Calditrichota bacterium]